MLELVLSALTDCGLEDFRSQFGEHLFAPQLNWAALSLAAFNSFGRVLAQSDEFPDTQPIELLSKWQTKDDHFILAPLILEDGSPSNLALFEPSALKSWDLDPKQAAILNTQGCAFIGVWISSLRSPFDLVISCQKLGLTGAQTKLVAALVRNGDLRSAARSLGIAYSTAREFIGDAMKVVGAGKRAALVDMVTKLCLGVLPEGSQYWRILVDSWGLTIRQARLAAALSAGMSRENVAKSNHVSHATAKKELTIVYERLGITSASELATFMVETAYIAALSKLVQNGRHFAFDRYEPLRLISSKADNRVIGISDYGPIGGKPVLVLHSSSSSRPVPRALVLALQRDGFRPFSIDRPGFGATDPINEPGDPFVLACADIRTVCEELGFEAFDLVARGGAQVALHFAHQFPNLLKRVVLVAPDPPTRISKPTKGILGALKRLVQANPYLTEALATLIVSNIRQLDTKSLILKAISGSLPDEQVMQDPQNVIDCRRGFQMFTSGKIKGYAVEQAALVLEADPPVLRSTHDWLILIGAHDPLHHPEEMQFYWQSLLPEAHLSILPDGGRFLAMSHTEVIVEHLSRDF
jgi:pimeloyl-ACP methyl ester carboxylesterase/DNA-binding CsgD family transcriptional regulator